MRRLRFCVAGSVLLTFLVNLPLPGQVSSHAPNNHTVGLTRLLRTEVEYLRRSKDSSGAPSDTKYPLYIPNQFGLDESDQRSLEEVALKWEENTKVIRSQLNSEVTAWRNSLPATGYRSGRDPLPPASLPILRAKLAGITEQAAAELENAFGSSKFRMFSEEVDKALGEPSAKDKVLPSGGAK